MANNDDIKVDNISTAIMDEGDSIAIKRIGSLEEDTSDSKVDTPKQQLQSAQTIQEHSSDIIQSTITHDMHKIRNKSAISTLGFNSDRDDYCKGPTRTHREEVISEDSGTTMNKIKGWFSTSSESQDADVDDDDDQSCASNYQNMATPDIDKSRRNTTTTNDDEEVIGKCSFFYNNAPISNEEDECYFDQLSTIEQYHRQQRGRLNPRAMAQAIKTQAKRQWTERRYRRRLRQSTQLGTTPYSIYNESTNTNGSNHDEFQYELSEEHRNAFVVAHAALNDQTSNEYTRNRHAIRKQYGYDNYNFSDEYDLELAQDDEPTSPGRDEIRADLTKSSLSIRGSGLIRLPADNVRLVCDSQLQPGILSIETRDVDGAKGYENYCNGNRYGNIHNSGIMMMPSISSKKEKKNHKATRRRRRKQNGNDSPNYNNILRRQELAYVLTVDEQIYRRLVQEMGDAYRYPCGIYYCFHVTDDGNHVGIGVAVAILLVIFVLLVIGMILWPTW